MTDLQPVAERLRAFVAERDWAQFHDPKNLVMALASEVGELTALFRWVRGDESDAFATRPGDREQIEAEVADVAICLLLLADRLGIDLADAMARKIDHNAAKYPADLARGKAEKPRGESP